MKDIIKPLKARAMIGNRHRMGLNMKLNSRAEAFLRKMNMAVVAWNGPKIVPSFSRVDNSSERRPVILAGIVALMARPAPIPITNKPTAMRIHSL